MAPFNSQRGTGRPLIRASSATAGLRVAKGETPQRRGNVGTLNAITRIHLHKTTVPPTHKGRMDPMNVSLDLASQIGMSIRDSDENNDVAESNSLYVEQLTADRYNFDDSLEESEEMQATRMKKKLLDKLAANNIQLSAKSAEDEKQDYEEYSDVLDRGIVSDRLKRVRLFAEHLRKVSNNRTSLFARLAEPMAEEHWLLDSSFHERMVDVFRNMSELVNELPDIAIAARHCIAPALSDNEFTDTDTDDTDSRARQIAQMELFVHQVDQLITQTKNAK